MSSMVSRRTAIARKSDLTGNILIFIVVAGHSLQLLRIPFGATGELIGAVGTVVALFASLLSPKTMFLMLFGLNFIPLTGPALSQFRVYVLIYFIYAFRLCATPAVYQLLVGNSPASRVMRRWLCAWLGFAILAAFFYVTTANTPFGVGCAWDSFAGLGTSLLACILAVLAFDDVREDSLLPLGFVVYVLLGAVLLNSMFDEVVQVVGTVRLGREVGAEPNAIAMVYNIGIGVCMGVVLLSRLLAYAYCRHRRHFAGGGADRSHTVAVGCLGRPRHGGHGGISVNVPRLSAFLKRIAMLGVFLVAALVVALPLAQDYLLARLEQTLNSFQAGNLDRATSGRSEIFYAYWLRTVDSSFIGTGFDYADIAQRYGHAIVAHNTWLQMLADFGIIGLGLLIVMTLPAFRLVFREVWMFGATQSIENKRLTALRTWRGDCHRRAAG